MSDQPNRPTAASDALDANQNINKPGVEDDGQSHGKSEVKPPETNVKMKSESMETGEQADPDKSSQKQSDPEEGEIPENDTGAKKKDTAKPTGSHAFPITQLPDASMLTTSKDCKEWMAQVQTEVRIKGSRKRFDYYPK